MNLLERKAFYFVFFVFFVFKLQGQENTPDIPPPSLKKNAVYGTLGIFPLFYESYSINAERELWSAAGLIKSTRIRLGAGEWGGGGFGEPGEGMHLTATLNVLTGARTFHVEANLGAIYLYDKLAHEHRVLPAGRLGFRFQNPGEYLLFRFGSGFPEIIYLSFGFAF